VTIPNNSDSNHVLWPSYCKVGSVNAATGFHLHQNDLPASWDLLSNIYVDNIMSGFYSEEHAINYFKQSRSVLDFNLHFEPSIAHSWTVWHIQTMLLRLPTHLVYGWTLTFDMISASPNPDTVEPVNQDTRK